VVESLLSSLGNQDNIFDLQRRLRFLSGDLEDLYQHLLMNRIGPFYVDRVSVMFQVSEKHEIGR